MRNLSGGIRAAAARAGVALLVALALAAVLPALVGAAPLPAVTALLRGAFGNPLDVAQSRFVWTETLLRAVPILFTGLAVAWGFRAGLFNIGAEGQLLWGAVAAAWVGEALRLPPLIHGVVALAAAALAGATWAWPAALLKVRRGTPEVVTTLLLSFVAAHLTTFLASHPLHDPARQGPRTADIQPAAHLPTLHDSRLHAGLLLAVLFVALLVAVLRRGRFGFGLEVVGQNPAAARSAGLPVERFWTRVLLQSGALAGLAGGIEILGIHHYFQSGFSPGYGYEGIAVAILGGSTPGGVAAAALFWGGLANGAVEMELDVGVSRHLVTVIQALVILVVAVRRWPFRRTARVPAGGAGASG